MDPFSFELLREEMSETAEAMGIWHYSYSFQLSIPIQKQFAFERRYFPREEEVLNLNYSKQMDSC